MTSATGPVPGPGILDIAPYVGGDSKAPATIRFVPAGAAAAKG